MSAGGEALPARTSRDRTRRRGRLRTSLPYYGYRTAEAAVGLLPHGAVYRIGALTGDVLYRTRPARFSGLEANLRQVLAGASEDEVRRTVRANVRNLMRSWVDVMEMSRARRSDQLADRVHPIDLDNMLGPLSRGRGAIIVSLHLGSWEIGLAGWNHRFGRMSLLAERLEPARLFARVVAARNRLGVSVIPLDISAGNGDGETARPARAAALREVIRTLRAGGMVAVAIDRDVTGTGQPFAFFGGTASIATGPVEIAIRTGAAIVPVWLLRSGPLGDQVVAPCLPEVVYDPQAPREQEVRRVTAELLTRLEDVIRAHPDQWHVLDPVFTGTAA